MITLGEKTKHLRNKNHLTQKQLGLALGFSEDCADIRIAEYESGERMFTEKIFCENSQKYLTSLWKYSSFQYYLNQENILSRHSGSRNLV